MSSTMLASAILLAMMTLAGRAQKVVEEVKVCELADLESLSWSKCEMQDRLSAIEQQLHDIAVALEMTMSQPVISPAKTKRKNEFIRFGKRSSAHRLYRTLEKEAAPSDTLSMAKRKNEFIRFG